VGALSSLNDKMRSVNRNLGGVVRMGVPLAASYLTAGAALGYSPGSNTLNGVSYGHPSLGAQNAGAKGGMNFWQSIGQDFIGGAVQSLGAGVGGALVNEAFPPDYDKQQEQTQAGFDMEFEQAKRLERMMYKRAKRRGLTPWEYYGSGASGGANVSGGASTLGNNAAQMEQVNKQMGSQAYMQARQQDTALKQTQIQADAQIKSAQIAANATTYSADTSAGVQRLKAYLDFTLGAANYDLKSREFEEVILKKAAAEINLSEAQLKKTLNEALTADPNFVLKKAKMMMGVDNSINFFLQERFGIDITNGDQVRNLSREEARNVLSVFIAAGSSTYQNALGVAAIGSNGEDQFAIDPVTGGPAKGEDHGQLPADAKLPTLGTDGQGRRNWLGGKRK
jgi:hypothetical protein